MNMISVTEVVKSVGPKLVPFFKTTAIYFVMFISTEKPSIFSTVIKCLPIWSLMLFVLLHGLSLGDQHKYSRRILIGLLFCSIGDACLIWPGYFEPGMLSFAVGHVYYVLAFGFRPLNMKIGAFLCVLAAISLALLIPGLEGVLKVGVPIYTMIITVMVWRGIARAQFLENEWTFSSICSCLGAILFALSDLILGLDMFSSKVEHSQALVMSTYYAAQLGIALSVVDSKSSN
ncbi:lysoplasmalogenase-like protein TMEM86A [Aethina tumida]|uniref:lysoplasmalogenase-like protein TMEM86A n=1 Tax=Aethina tumida TaxID=116153 RepID=UPI00096ADB78|nr:lysoplasmalogenase-like protein TMEM86A [Aethina tumida]